MPDPHVPLDEAEFIKWAYYNKEASLTGTQAREVWKYISNLKHTICVEIEERKLSWADKNNNFTKSDMEMYNSGLDDALSVKSLKESE